MEIFLNDYDVKDKDLELVKKEEVVEKIALVTIVYPKAKHKNVEVMIETKDYLQNETQIEEQRYEPRVEERVELTTPSISISNKMNVQGEVMRNKARIVCKGNSQ